MLVVAVNPVQVLSQADGWKSMPEEENEFHLRSRKSMTSMATFVSTPTLKVTL